MFKRIREIESRYEELERLLSDPEIIAKQAAYQRYAKEHADLRELVETFRLYEKTEAQIREDQELLRGTDEDIREMAKEELPVLQETLAGLEERLKRLLLPKDPTDERNVFLEIRAGTGGDEAGAFRRRPLPDVRAVRRAQALEDRGCQQHAGRRHGGFKEIIALITGRAPTAG